ncbi:YopT-type cysteine protease domain-containing protein [Mesorhizobium koreense]|jgi:hypothetical protein|uniref:YopT-type cysteine protease domain-containing protein n=1 Tax=Mesorhizobium koreense TaxID=3074855 RepID=UPI00287B746C|nr:YopT-type cysteine protease domain-containing protein [Mesorhizobium sp. WR6]
MATKIDLIRDLTKGLDGIFREFSQSYKQIKNSRSVPGLYTNDKNNVQGNVSELYVGGMCHIMSAFWLVGQIHGLGEKRTRFIEWVVPGGNSEAINLNAVGVLVAKTVMYKAKGGKAQSLGILKDSNFDDTFFSNYGIRAKHESFDGFANITQGVGRSRDRLYLIGYGGQSSGHACAAQSSTKGGHAYFDPNYGEAILTSRKAWEAWYKQYLVISGYDQKYLGHQRASGYKSIASN